MSAPSPQNQTPRLGEAQGHREVVCGCSGWKRQLRLALTPHWSFWHLMKATRSSQCSATEASWLRSQMPRGSESWHRLPNCVPPRFLTPKIFKHYKIAGIPHHLWRGFWNSNKSLGGSSLGAQWQRTLLPGQETQVLCLGQEDPLEKEMATHSNILAWRIPWTEEPGSQGPGVAKSQTWLSD